MMEHNRGMKNHALVLLVLFALAPLLAYAAPTVSVSVNPAVGLAPYPATLTWTSDGARCVASDSWTGAQATSGTKQVTITAASKFTLTCYANDGKVTVSWTPPVKNQNTDGTPLTNLAGYSVYRGTTADNLAVVTSPGKTTLTWDDTALASGTYLYAVTASNSAGIESVKSAISSSVVAGSSTTAAATAAIQTVPNPPASITTTVATAYEIRPNTGGALTASRIGVIPLGTPCSSDTKTVSGVKYNRVSASAIDLINWPQKIPPTDTYARCAGG